MSYITFEMVNKLKSVNFSFPEYEHFLNLGMIYYFRGDEYFIGGSDTDPFSETDKIVASEGCWLPTDTQLLEWLESVQIDAFIHLAAGTGEYFIQATDRQNGACYKASGKPLAFVVANVIYKICKSNLRDYIPSPVDRIAIDY